MKMKIHSTENVWWSMDNGITVSVGMGTIHYGTNKGFRFEAELVPADKIEVAVFETESGDWRSDVLEACPHLDLDSGNDNVFAYVPTDQLPHILEWVDNWQK